MVKLTALFSFSQSFEHFYTYLKEKAYILSKSVLQKQSKYTYLYFLTNQK